MKSLRLQSAFSGFLLALILTCWTVGHLADVPEMGTLDDKLRYFSEHQDDYDLVFVGSSRLHRGVVPALFDAEMAALGHPVRSFNFGTLGMQAHEASSLLRRLLANKPARLRYVVIEPGEFDPELPAENRFKRRVIFWHDRHETLAVWRSTLARQDLPWTRRADLLMTHGLHFVAQAMALDRGFDLIQRIAPTPVAPSKLADLVKYQGFLPYTPQSYEFSDERKAFLADLASYRQQVAALGAERPREKVPAEGLTQAIAAQRAELESLGLTPIYVIPATLHAQNEFHALNRSGVMPRLLAFDDPTEYARLYDENLRFDPEHLTQEGADLFTRLLAERLAREVF